MTYKNSFPFENKSTLHFICTVMDCYVHIFQILSYLCAITIQISQSFLHFNLECVHMLPTRLMEAGQKPSNSGFQSSVRLQIAYALCVITSGHLAT